MRDSRPRASAVLLALVFALGAAAPARAQSDTTMIDRQYRAARDLERDGQVEPARQAYRQILEAEPNGAHAADALLGLARLSWNVTAPDQLGKRAVDAKALEDARAALEQVTQKYRTSAAAPDALWRLALLRLEPGNPQYDAQAARAALITLPALYPDAPQVPQALALAAGLELEDGRPARARGLAFRLLADWPDHPDAVEGWIALAAADAREKRYTDALAAAGRARRVAEGREAASGQAALAVGTLADRLAFAATRGASPFETSTGATLPARVRDLHVAPDGSVVAAMASDNVVLTLSPAGAVTNRAPGDVNAVAIDRWGRTWTGAGTALVGPAGVGRIALPEKTDVVAIAVAGPRAAWIADGRGRRVVRAEAVATNPTVVARLPERANPVALAPSPGGGAWVLDARNPALIDIGPDGAARRTIPIAQAAKEPIDLDRDALGNLYVLDENAPALLVYAPDGALLLRHPILTEGESGIGKPTALAVDRFGAVVVFDAKRKRLAWLR